MTFDSEEDLERFLKAFGEGTLPRAQWTHAAHVAVAAHHALTYSEPAATTRVRAGILHYNNCQGITNTADSGYHETLTQFWMAVVRARLAAEPAGTSVLTAIRNVVVDLGARRDLHREYYSFDVVRCREARRRWTAPDIRALPGAGGGGEGCAETSLGAAR